jgi:hypothetical protein
MEKRSAMTSRSQIEANRRNALMSTGPKTEAGKSRSRSNAVRHGLTAETVIEVLEDPEDYKAFELSVTSDFDAQTAVERELVLRLARLLWRLRRATAIETGLLQIHSDNGAELIADHGRRSQRHDRNNPDAIVRWRELARTLPGGSRIDRQDGYDLTPHHDGQDLDCAASPQHTINTTLADCYLRLVETDNGAFERLSRYETALWRQVGQILFTLDFLRRRGGPL